MNSAFKVPQLGPASSNFSAARTSSSRSIAAISVNKSFSHDALQRRREQQRPRDRDRLRQHLYQLLLCDWRRWKQY